MSVVVATLNIVEPTPNCTRNVINNGYPATGTSTGVPSVQGFLQQGATVLQGLQTCCANGVWTVDFGNIPNGTYTLLVASTVTGGPSDSRTVTFQGHPPPAPAPIPPAYGEPCPITCDLQPDLDVAPIPIVLPEEGVISVTGTYEEGTVLDLKFFFLHANMTPVEGERKRFSGGFWRAKFVGLQAMADYTLLIIAKLAGRDCPTPISPITIDEEEPT